MNSEFIISLTISKSVTSLVLAIRTVNEHGGMYRQKRGGANSATSNQPYVQAEERQS